MKIYILAFLLSFLFSIPSTPHRDNQKELKINKPDTASIVLKSTDGGQTWQDIGEELREILQGEGIRGVSFFANDNGLFLRAGNGVYHSKPNSTAPFWTKEFIPDEYSSITTGKTGIFAFNSDGQFLQKINETSKWSPVYTNLQQKSVYSVFESSSGSIFIGNNLGFFKSTNSGKTWKQVHTGVYYVAESNGVFMGVSGSGIIRSTDDGESWELVVNEARRGFHVEPIKGGFAVLFSPTAKDNREVRTTYDGAKTWQSIDEGLPVKATISSIIQVGENFFCGNSTGIFRSSNKGKTWKLILPTVEGKIFNLFVSGNVLYAVPRFQDVEALINGLTIIETCPVVCYKLFAISY